MAAIYANLIINGQKTIDDVPKRIQAEVAAILKAAGHDDLANPGD